MTAYPVNTIYKAIQGEGALCGRSMVLVRMQGCNVGCPWCDTQETWYLLEENSVGYDVDNLSFFDEPEKFSWITGFELAHLVHSRFSGPKWVLLTGGEPALYDLVQLVRDLHYLGYAVAVETSGTADGVVGAEIDHLCVSPKLYMPGGRKVLPTVLAIADEIKMVVGKPKDIENLEALLRFSNDAIISLQPVSLSEKATKLCYETVLARGWNLSLQMHKYLGVP